MRMAGQGTAAPALPVPAQAEYPTLRTTEFVERCAVPGPTGAALACGSCVADLEALLVGLARRCWAVACVLACIRRSARCHAARPRRMGYGVRAAPACNRTLPKGIQDEMVLKNGTKTYYVGL